MENKGEFLEGRVPAKARSLVAVARATRDDELRRWSGARGAAGGCFSIPRKWVIERARRTNFPHDLWITLLITPADLLKSRIQPRSGSAAQPFGTLNSIVKSISYGK
jgi:hypothetical protein